MKESLPFDPNVEIFRWGPLPMKIYYSLDFAEGIFSDERRYRNLYPNHHWPDGMFLKKKGKMVFVEEFPTLRKKGEKIFIDFMLQKDKKQKVWDGWIKDNNNVKNIENEIDSLNLRNLPEEGFWKLWDRFANAVIDFWTHVVIPELGNYGSGEFLERKLQEHIPEKDIPRVLEILTAPTKTSYYQQEEIELSKTSNIGEHTKKYYWLRNGYGKVQVLNKNFFEKKKRELSKTIEAEIHNYFEKVKKQKKDIQEEFNLPKNIVEIGKTIAEGVVWQDTRKKEILIYLHYKTILLDEVIRRYKYEKEELLNFSALEIGEKIKKEGLNASFAHRNDEIGFYCGGIFEEIEPKTAKKYWDLYAEERIEENLSEIRGIVASKGRVSGTVRVVPDPYNIGDFNKGDVLIAPMTSPEYVFVMKKASAIVTDAGGLTSHAAIVSRELGVPCIVGTKVATKLFKDGDKIEVDANNGVVKKI